MDVQQKKKQTVDFIVCQTGANESMESINDFLRSEFENQIRDHLGESTNRKHKRLIEETLKDQMKKFDKIYKDYMRTTTKMLNHFDNWEMSDKIDEKVNRLYEYLEKE